MNFFDIILVSMISISVIAGIVKGAIFTGVNIIKIIVIFLITLIIIPFASEVVEEYSKKYVNLISLVISFLLSYTVTSIVFSYINEYLKPYTGGPIDRIIGLAIGTIRGGIYCFVIFIFLSVMTTGSFFESENAWKMIEDVKKDLYPKWIKNSESFYYLNNGFDKFTKIVEGTFVETYLTDIDMKHTDDKESLKLKNDIQDKVPENVKIEKINEDSKPSTDNKATNQSSDESNNPFSRLIDNFSDDLPEDDIESIMEKAL